MAEGNILEKITCFAVFAVIGLSIYGICLAFCLETAFKRMANGQSTPQAGTGANRSMNYVGGSGVPVGRTNTRDEENSGNRAGFNAFKGKG